MYTDNIPLKATQQNVRLTRRPVVRLVVSVGDGEVTTTKTYNGRFANTLAMLIDAGEEGITQFDNPGPRLSHYVMRLRRSGLTITTTDVKHSGPFPGVHGLYKLATVVRVLEVEHDPQ